ncbi:conserved hypothetical protein [Coccidioides posadasii str. Silveira]|uniref:Uncharacterized protein n=1 Tax=Coccidioides posadasii (strain RMSCC 757 / Silveira) TaxID=443226 RepID=E9DBM2_COCPS|nr:conserved hypothetical protein [Coccidioides posadasii str. Silveira]
MATTSINGSDSHQPSDKQASPLRSSALLADLIPILIVLIYAVAITCYFHDGIISCCRGPILRRWRRRTGTARKRGYVSVANDDGEEEEEEEEGEEANRSHNSQFAQLRHKHADEEATIELQDAKPAKKGKKKKKNRPKSLVLRGYTPLPSCPEDLDHGEETEMETRMHRVHQGLEQRWERASDVLRLSRYFDGNTGQLKRCILMEPETELSQMRMKEDSGLFEHIGGFGDHVIGRWFDRTVHRMVELFIGWWLKFCLGWSQGTMMAARYIGNSRK